MILNNKDFCCQVSKLPLLFVFSKVRLQVKIFKDIQAKTSNPFRFSGDIFAQRLAMADGEMYFDKRDKAVRTLPLRKIVPETDKSLYVSDQLEKPY